MHEYIDNLVGGVTAGVKQAVIEGIKEGLIKLFTWIATGILASSYWICLFVCIAALFLYMAGVKKSGKYIGISFIVFFILQCLKVVFI
jgi:hypothetical protein